MTRLIRWGHLPDGRIAVLWWDAVNERTQSSIVDGITLERIEGEPLSLVADNLLADDMTRRQRGWQAHSYAGVVEPASEAL